MFARVALIAALLALACFGGVRASSVDSWAAAPAALADAWPQELNAPAALSANELEMRHAEFMQTLSTTADSSSSSSSTGPAESSSSSSTGPVEESSTGPTGPVFADATVLSTYEANSTHPIPRLAEIACETIFNQTGFPNITIGEKINCTSYFVRRGEVRLTAGRRLLQLATDEVQQLKIVFTPSTRNSPVATKVAEFFGEQLKCGTNDTCREVKAAAAGFEPLELPEEVMESFIAGSVQVDNGMLIIDDPVARPTVGTDGDARRTNGGYYFLAAVLALFIVIAAIYFVMHKAPAAAAYKDESAMRRGGDAEMAHVGPAAGAASGVVVAEEAAPLGAQQQMDYRSVFALKHNVLERKEEQKAEDDEQTHNDVHFILHQ